MYLIVFVEFWKVKFGSMKNSERWWVQHHFLSLVWIVHKSRKLAVASWSYSCFSKGRGRSESNRVIFHSNPPSSRGILKRCWKQMVTGSNPARSLGNLYSAYQHYQHPIKIPSCFQVHMNLSFRSPTLGPQVSLCGYQVQRSKAGSKIQPASAPPRIPCPQLQVI